MPDIKVVEKQNIFDVAVQETGTLDTLFLLLADNDLSVDTIDQSIPESTVNIDTYREQRQSEINRITEPVFSGDDDDTKLEGIGYWGIEKDFIVS